MGENKVEQITEQTINMRQTIKKKKWWQKEKRAKLQSEGTSHVEMLHLLANRVDRYMNNGRNCLTFTSYLEKQGKTYTVYQLGKALAKAGCKTLIIDCNIMAPALSHMEERLQAEGAKGFLDFIGMGKEKEDKITYSEVIPYIKASGMAHLYFMPIKQNALGEYTEYIRKEEVENLFHLLKDKFEIILIEAPSFQNISYTQSIIEASDGYFMLIKSGTIEKREAHRMKKMMSQIAAENIGVILNKTHSG